VVTAAHDGALRESEPLRDLAGRPPTAVQQIDRRVALDLGQYERAVAADAADQPLDCDRVGLSDGLAGAPQVGSEAPYVLRARHV
jgi:hypothetical protein